MIETQRVRTAVAALTGRPEAEIDTTARFSTLGLDSAGTTALVAELAKAFDRPLSPTVAWDNPTVAELAGYLAGATESRIRTSADVPVDEPIAIVGMSCRFPGAPDLDAFWRLLMTGQDAVTEVPPDRWHAAEPAWGGFIDGVDQFDPQFFGISPREAAAMDPQQRIMLELAWSAVEDSGVDPLSLRGSETGVFTGALWNDYARLAGGEAITQHTATGEDLSIIPARISYTLGLRGPSLGVTTACSGALVAVHLACQSLRLRETERALAGGVNLLLAPESTTAMARLGATSPRGRSRAFDAGADGYVRAEGGGLVVLKRLEQALADGDRIYCVIRGSAINNDGYSNGLTAPNPRAQEDMLVRAYARAGVDPSRVHYVEAHGTGTPLGDPIETGALGRVLGAGRPADRPLLIGSVKTNIGHLEAAAGIAGLIKTALAVHNRVVPGSLHFEQPNPDIDFTGLEVVTRPRRFDGEVIAGVSSFGFGGTNSHVVLAGWQAPRTVFVFSGQGSQWAGMGRDLLRDEPVFRDAVEECAAAFAELGGAPVQELLQSTDRLQDSDVLQPLVFTVQIGLAALWRSWGLVPDAVVGHSLGEVAAAHTAGCLDLRDAVSVVHHRSRLMSRLDGKGAVALVGLDVATAERVAAEHGVAVAGENGPQATVLAGAPKAIEACLEALRRDDVECHRVAMSVASHTAQCDQLLPELGESLAGLRPRRGRVPFVSTVTGKPYEQPLDSHYWQRNLRERVRFASAIRALPENRVFLEVGPHPVLGRALTGLNHLSSLRKGENGQEALHATATELRRLGVDLASRPAEPPLMLALSAHTEDAARAQAHAVADLVEADADLAAVSAAVARVRSGHRHRVAVVVRDRAGAVEQLRKAVPAAVPRQQERLAFVFSGQGTQWQGMGIGLLRREPVFRRAMERHDSVIRELAGWSMFDGPRLSDTRIAQPALCALQLSLVELWEHWGVRPDAVAGHSVGEIAAACVAGALSPQDALRVAVERGRVMQQADGGGRMVSVGLPEAEVAALIDGLADRVGIAAVNSPAATVIAGDTEAVEKILTRLKGVRTKPLDVDYAFHSPQMEPFQAQLAERLAGLAPDATQLPMVSTVTGQEIDGTALDAEHWARTVRRTVRFADAVTALGCKDFLEIGSHPALGPAVVQCLGADRLVLPSMRRGDDIRTLLGSRAALWASGRPARLTATPSSVRLPEYPWQRQRHWLTSEPKAIPRYVMRWERRSVTPGSATGRWLLVGGGDLAAKLGDRLRANGATIVPHAGVSHDAVVHLEAMESGATASALGLAQRLAGRPGAKLWMVTRNARSLAGAGLWGFGSALAHEHPGLLGGLIDVDSPDDVQALADALTQADGENRVAIRDGERLVARLTPLPAETVPGPALDPEAAYLITGGLGGIGLVLVQHLVQRGARNLVLVGRSEPSAAAQAVLTSLDAQVTVARADVSQRADIARVLAEIRAPLKGIVHAAGVLDDGIMMRQDPQRFERVLAPKAFGALHLHELTDGMPLDFFVLFSSFIGTLGAVGQTGYAAANAVLDALAVHRRAHGAPATSIAWGPWRDTGMTSGAAAEKQRWQERGLTPLERDACLQAFDRAIAGQAEPHELVLDVDWTAWPAQPFLDLLVSRDQDHGELARALDAAYPDDRAGIVADHVAARTAEALGVTDSRQVDRAAGVFDLGLDSQTALELAARLGRDLGEELPATTVLDYPTVTALATHLTQRLAGEADLAALLDEIENLPEDEVARRLGRVSKSPSAIAGPDAVPGATAETHKDNQYSLRPGGDARNRTTEARFRPPAGASSHRTGTPRHDLAEFDLGAM